MSREEIAWLDGYHQEVRRVVGPLLSSDDRAWLDEATRPLAAA